MSEAIVGKLNFEHQLQMEAERVLSDVAFERAPIQSRLLRYLVDRAVAGRGQPSQYEIAVDGLGKDEDYDLEGDSYPRVQVSRLRKTLENYYSRNAPGNGLRIRLDTGGYALSLVGAEDRDPADKASPMSLSTAAQQRIKRVPMSLMGAAVLGVVGLIATPILLLGLAAPQMSAPEKPTVALEFDMNSGNGALSLPPGLQDRAHQLVSAQLDASFVSKTLRKGQQKSKADFVLKVNFSSDYASDLSAQITLLDAEGEVVYSNAVPVNPVSVQDFARELEASVIHMTSPAGVIASVERAKFVDYLSSDYACFITIEDKRSNGAAVAKMVDQCINAFPDSEFKAFWYARRAYMQYQSQIVAGQKIDRRGKAWSDLRVALEADQFNAFAVFVAAKVELANGNCSAAQRYVDRALEKGSSFPAFIAALETSAAACDVSPEKAKDMAARIKAISNYNLHPDPLLQLYLVLAALAANDRESAAIIADRVFIEDPKGPVDTTSDLLRRSLADKEFARENSDRLKTTIEFFVWNPTAAENLVAEILS